MRCAWPPSNSNTRVSAWASVLAFYGGAALVTALILGLVTVLVPWLAALLVGVVVLGVAGALALVGKKQAQRAGSLMPEESAASVKADINTIKEGMHR
jgi:membrane protein